MTKDTIVAELEQLGFTTNEANVYLALIQKGAMTATAIAATTGLARTAVYPTLNSLVDQGLVDAGEGYGSNFSAVPADRALPHLMLERERITRQIVDRIASLADESDRTEGAPEELIQVIRNPRTFAERHVRLLLETNRTLEAFCKPPMVGQTSDRTIEKILRRGVRVRALYEPALLEDPAIRRDLADWIALGEEVRVYDGQLPHKLSIFDRKRVFLVMPTQGEQRRTLYIEHSEVAASFGITFETLWAQSEPLIIADLKKSDAGAIHVRKRAANGQANRARK